MSEHIKTEALDGVLTLRLDRLDKYNALTNTMYMALTEAINAANADESVQVVVITGGPSCFTAGNDLQDFLQSPPQHLDAPAFRFMRAVVDFEKPLIAAVAGPAIGIGSTLLPHCDLVYVTRNAKLSMPFVSLGLCHEFAASLTIPAAVGQARANALLLAGESIDGETAATWGLANAAFDDGEACLAAAYAQAKKLAKQPETSLRLSKQLIKAPQRQNFYDIIRQENKSFIARLKDAETRAILDGLANRSKAKR
jgi:enoyl-CoA hydratase/carnithine racemase